MFGGFGIFVRLSLLALSVTLCFGGIVARLVWLHVLEQPTLVASVQENRKQVEILRAPRGNIVDARGKLLAGTRPIITVGVDPQMVTAEDFEKIPALATLLKVPEEDIREAFERTVRKRTKADGTTEMSHVRWVKLAEGVGERDYNAAMELDVGGVYGNRQFERYYPAGRLASHVLGFINREQTAVTGIERFLDFYLSGQEGWRESEHDGRRRELAQYRSREIEPTAGLNVELSIDQYVQHVIELQLQKIAQEYQPDAATIIVSDPYTGFIHGIGNWPTFDPNNLGNSTPDMRRNRALTDLYEPGSTFKIVPVAAALEEKLVERDSLFDCDLTSIEYKGRLISLPHDHAEGELTVDEILVHSSNRGAAQLGMRLGEKRLYDYARKFGFGQQTGLGERLGLGANTETAGILYEPRRWDGLTISRLPMGHAISATPIQVHYAMASIANGGVLMEPQVVRRVFDVDGATALAFAPKARHRVLSGATARDIADILSGVTLQDGTATRAHLEGFKVAGKTGTTQKIIDGRYSNSEHIASFSGFFPAENPRLVITVVVDNARTKGTAYGGVVAAPAFKSVAEKLIQYFDIRPVQNKENELFVLQN